MPGTTADGREAPTTDRRGAPAGDGAPPPPWSVILRPVGYLLVGAVWTAIWLIAVLLLVGSVPYLALVDSESLVTGVGERLSDPLGVLGLLLVALPVLALAVGAGGWHVLTASWPLAVLSFVYVARGLDRRYRGERLSQTTRGAWGSTFGPPTLTGVALSLQPVRPSAFTDRVMRYYVAGWTVDGRTVLAMLPAGLAWPLAVVALVPGLPQAVHVVAAVVATALLVASLVLGVRAFRRRFSGAGAARPDDRPLTELSPDARRARRARLEQQRRARLARGGPDGS